MAVLPDTIHNWVIYYQIRGGQYQHHSDFRGTLDESVAKVRELNLKAVEDGQGMILKYGQILASGWQTEG